MALAPHVRKKIILVFEAARKHQSTVWMNGKLHEWAPYSYFCSLLSLKGLLFPLYINIQNCLQLSRQQLKTQSSRLQFNKSSSYSPACYNKPDFLRVAIQGLVDLLSFWVKLALNFNTKLYIYISHLLEWYSVIQGTAVGKLSLMWKRKHGHYTVSWTLTNQIPPFLMSLLFQESYISFKLDEQPQCYNHRGTCG